MHLRSMVSPFHVTLGFAAPSLSPSPQFCNSLWRERPGRNAAMLGFPGLRMCTKLPENSASGTRGVGRPGSMPYSSPQGGVGHGGVVFSYEPRTPDSRGVVHGGVIFSYKLRTPDSRGGLAMGGSFSATNHVLPIPEGGCPWGVIFQLQTMYFRFRRKKPVQRAWDFRGIAPECVYTFSRWRRGRLARPGNAGPGPTGQAVLRSPEGPF